jgi:PAS domain S-box-containing protein
MTTGTPATAGPAPSLTALTKLLPAMGYDALAFHTSGQLLPGLNPGTEAKLAAGDTTAARVLARYVRRRSRAVALAAWQEALAAPGKVVRARILTRAPGCGGLVDLAAIYRPEEDQVVLALKDVTDEAISRDMCSGTEHTMATAQRVDSTPAAMAVLASAVERSFHLTDPDAGVILYYLDSADQSLHHATGLRMQEVNGTGDPLRLTPDIVRSQCDNALAAADVVEARRLQLVNRAAAFSYCWLSPLRATGGEALGLLAVFHNKTEQPCVHSQRILSRYIPLATLLLTQRTQSEQVKLSEARFHSSFHQSITPSAVVDPSGRFTQVNNALVDLTGRSAKELLSITVDDLTHPDGEEDTGTGLIRWARPDGQEVWVQRSSARPEIDPTGRGFRLEQYVDVTDRKRSDAKVRSLAESLHGRDSELGEVKASLAAAYRRLARVRDTERRSIARRLHDGPIQELVALGWIIQDLQVCGADEERKAEAVAAVNNASRSLREAVVDLYPAGLDVGVGPVLSSQARKILGEDVELRFDDRTSQPLEAEMAHLVYRTAVEALRNIRKHANATTVSVTLREIEQDIVVTVLDDGEGFSPEVATERANEGHIGVVSMREDINLAGGRFHIGARADQVAGTEVTFALPRTLHSPAAPSTGLN